MQRKMHSVMVLLLALGISMLHASAPAIAADKPDKLRIAYITPVGRWQLYGWPQPLRLSRMKGSTSNSSISELAPQWRRSWPAQCVAVAFFVQVSFRWCLRAGI